MDFQSLIYNAKQCQVLTVRDITQIERLAKLSADNKMLSLLTSSVTHEMITPLKCIIEFALRILNISKDPALVKEARLIVSTSKLLLSQVKLSLDKNMLDNGLFAPNFEIHPLNKTITEVVDILRNQALLQGISFELVLPLNEVTIKLD
jgi:signal transduction histidine kinase